MNLQQRLARALVEGNLKDFKEALRLNANPNQPDININSIYEKALASAGCAEFIKLCIEHGCSASYVNEGLKKAAINYAVESEDVDNLNVLLSYPGVQVNHEYNELTPLNALALKLRTDKGRELMECMKLLLEKGASPNIPDSCEGTPLFYVMLSSVPMSQKEQIVRLFLDQPDLDIDSYGDGELREELHEQMPHIKLPQVRPARKAIRAQLLSELHKDNAEGFQQLLAEYPGDEFEFLAECTKTGSHHVFDSLLPCLDHTPVQSECTRLAEIAVVYGNWHTLEKLLQHEQFTLPPNLELLSKVIGRLDVRSKRTWSDYKRCFDLLLECGQVNINEVDGSGRTPLHYAILFNHRHAVRSLLHHGAYLGACSAFKEVAIVDIEPDLLREHFDDCLAASELRRGDDNFKITLNFTNFKLRDDIKSRNRNEMEPIVAMGESKELRHLLAHPLIATFISEKGRILSPPFYCHFVLSLILSICATANILLTFSSGRDCVFMLLSWTAIVFFAACELIELILIPRLWSLDRVLNLAHVAMLIVWQIDSTPEMYTCRIIAAFTILLIAVRLTKLLGYLPVDSISTHILMLKVVSKNFFKSCLPYSILVVSFGLSFYILNFHNMSKSILKAIFKVIVMATGEFEEGNLDYKDNILASLFFVFFVLTVSIVLMNLLTAIAISDIQAIQSQAEVNGLICRANLLSRYEDFFVSCRRPFQRWAHIKNISIPATVYTFPNKEEVSTKISTAIVAGATELKPLILASKKKPFAKQHEINFPEDEIESKLSKNIIRKILKILSSRDRTEQTHNYLRF